MKLSRRLFLASDILCAEGTDEEIEQAPQAKRSRKPTARKAATELPKRASAAAKSTAQKAATEVARQAVAPAESEVASGPVCSSCSLPLFHVLRKSRPHER